MKKTNVMLLRMIKNSKSQFIAVLVIIVVGLSIYTAMNMASLNLETTLNTFYKDNNFASIFVSGVRIPQNKVDEIGKLSGVARSEGRIVFEVPFIGGPKDERANLRVVSIPIDNNGVNKVTITRGTNIQNEEQDVLVIQQFAEAQNLMPGDSIDVPMNGRTYKLRITGIAASPEYIYLMENAQTILPSPKTFGIIYISEKLAMKAFNFQGNYNEISIIESTNAKESILVDNIKNSLKNFGLKSVTTRENQLSNSLIDQKIKQYKRMSSSLPIVFLLVASIILEMTIGRMVKRDRIKIGVLKAVGYSNRDVLFHYAKYALMAGLTGGIVGISLGMILAGYMTKLFLEFFNIPLLKIEFYYQYIFSAMFISAIFCTIAGLIGAKSSLKISPAEAMQSEAPKGGKRILLERFKSFWKGLSFSWKFVYKNIFRNKKRTIFVMAGVILTYAMMLFTFTMPDILDEMMNKQFSEFQKMDYNINFSTPLNKSVVNEIGNLIDTSVIEGKIDFPFEIINGSKSKAVSIIGLKKNTVFYSFKNAGGSKIDLPEHGIVLTENLAKVLGAKVGNLVIVHSYFPNKKDTYIEVSGIIRQSLGINAYMNIDEMSSLLLEKNLITGVYFNSKDPYVTQKLANAKNIESISSIADMKQAFLNYLDLTYALLSFMILFSGALGFVIVYNATIISLSEREMEFSSLRVLGFSKFEIFKLLVKENNMITMVGILIGIPVGKAMLDYSAQTFSTEMYTFHMQPTLAAGIYSTIFTLIFILLAQAATYRKISKLDFLQAIKNRVS
ncbi:MAG: FtsX-like permease family protein [Eubacteriales bacterium]